MSESIKTIRRLKGDEIDELGSNILSLLEGLETSSAEFILNGLISHLKHVSVIAPINVLESEKELKLLAPHQDFQI